jgi:hypothetical protein
MEPIPPGCVAWRAVTTSQSYLVPSPIECLTISVLVSSSQGPRGQNGRRPPPPIVSSGGNPGNGGD